MIHILFNADNNVIDACKNVMRQVMAHVSDNVTFHIMGTEFESEYNTIFYDAPDLSVFKNTGEHGHITKTACYRLFAPFIKGLDKVIYLDTDVAVLKDIKELWDIPIKYIGAVLDPLYKYQASKNNLHTAYVNSGVMVLNLKGLRSLPYWRMIMATQSGNYNLSLLDQDIINIALGEYIELLPYEWNVYSKIYRETNEGMLEARKNPSIIHWCGKDKPYNCKDVWKREEWFK